MISYKLQNPIERVIYSEAMSPWLTSPMFAHKNNNAPIKIQSNKILECKGRFRSPQGEVTEWIECHEDGTHAPVEHTHFLIRNRFIEVDRRGGLIHGAQTEN